MKDFAESVGWTPIQIADMTPYQVFAVNRGGAVKITASEFKRRMRGHHGGKR